MPDTSLVISATFLVIPATFLVIPATFLVIPVKTGIHLFGHSARSGMH